MGRGQKIGFRHSEKSKKAISKKITKLRAAGIGGVGFIVNTECDICHQKMSKANLTKHRDRCIETRGLYLNGIQLSVLELKILRRKLKPHGWTEIEYIRIHNEQEGKCKICGVKQNLRLYADHCHATNKPRALLCNGCNLGGIFKDNIDILKNCIKYLESYM